MKRLFIGSTLLLLTVLFACSKSSSTSGSTPTPLPSDCSATISFSATVSPIISASCAIAGCHAAGSSNGPGALTTYAQISAAKGSISSAVANGSMPKGSSLSASQKQAIVCWVSQGGANN